MNIIQKSSRGFELIPMEDQLLSERIIFINGEITDQTANEFFKEVLHLNRKSRKEPIHLIIDSEGGQMNAGFVIHNIIQESPAPIRIYCSGKCYSIAAVLFASGQHGRYIFPDSELMIHQPLIPSGIGGNADSVYALSEKLIKARDKTNRILAQYSGKSEEEILEATRKDLFLSPEEAIEFGLADEIAGFGNLMKSLSDNQPF